MAAPPTSFPVGQAPWETQAQVSDATSGMPKSFPVGQAPWEKQAAAPQSQSFLDQPMFGGTPRQYIHGALEGLPVAGTLAGGVIGGMGMNPVTTVAGAGAGGFIGTSLRNTGEAMLGENKSATDAIAQPIAGGIVGAGQEAGGQLLAKGIGAAANSSLGQAALSKIGSGASKVGELFTGVPQQEIETYAKHADEINAMSKASDNDTQAAADSLRQKFTQNIQATRQQLNSQISQTLAKRADQTVDATPIIDALQAQKAKINATLSPDQVSHIDDLSGKISALAPDGKLSLQNAQDVKQWLQDIASPAYGGNGQIFQAGKQVQQAAKAAGAVARGAIEDEAPEIAGANAQLSQLRSIQKNANKNLFTAEKPAAAIMSAGSGGNPQNAAMLGKLGDATGTDMLGDAQKLAAMRTFGSPQLTPLDSTGKAVGRMGLAGGLGFVAGGPAGAVGAAALTSPAALKTAINLGQGAGDVAGPLLASPSVAGLLSRPVVNANTSVDAQQAKDSVQVPMAKQPAKGPDKWASDGIDNVIEHTDDPNLIKQIQDSKDDLLADPKTKSILVSASDLKPGSKAMDKLVDKLKSRISEGQ